MTDTSIQAKIDALTSSSSLDEMLQLTLAVKNSNNIACYVNSRNDLPSLTNDEYPVGSAIFVNEIQLPLVAGTDGWYAMDGRKARHDYLNAWSFGSNYYGQLGDNTTTNRSSPVSVVGGFTWKQVSAGYHTAAIKSDDTLWTWGWNNFGQLGDNNGTVSSRSSPVSVVGGFTWKQVSAGHYFTIGIKSDDTIWSWGRNNYGQLGDNNGTVTTRSSPVSVVGGFTWKQVSARGYHTAAIKSDDTLWAWGNNNFGQLGDNNGTVQSRSSPVLVVGGFTWKQVSAGWYHTTAIKSDNTLWAWGWNNYGQLGDNTTTTTRSSPVLVVGGFTWKQVSAGGYHTAAIKSDDTLWAWGWNTYGQLGDNTATTRSSPVLVVGGFTWKQVSVGQFHTASIKSDNTIWAWGRNNYGQLGDNNGTVSSRSSPVSVVGGFTWKSVSNSENVIALKLNVSNL